MLSNHLIALSLALCPSLALAGIFPPDSLVKMLDPPGWRKVMKINQTSIIAFVAPWCGHCQRMAPEYSKAAIGLYPLIPAYAVDCDAEINKPICSKQQIKGFPTVKLFPRGGSLPPIVHEGERSASALFYFASRRIPQQNNKKLYAKADVVPWIEERAAKATLPRALLVTKDKKLPILWQTLANKFDGQIEFGSHRDRHGQMATSLGWPPEEGRRSTVIVFPIGSKEGVRYEGVNKLESLSKFFDSVIDGTADLKVINKEAAEEEAAPLSPEEQEIAEKQEAQRIALLHGGFSDMKEFEEAVKSGKYKNYHGSDGHGMMSDMGDRPAKKKKVEENGERSASTAAPTTVSHPASSAEPVLEPETESAQCSTNCKPETLAAPSQKETPVQTHAPGAQATFAAPEPITQDAKSITTVPIAAKTPAKDEL